MPSLFSRLRTRARAALEDLGLARRQSFGLDGLDLKLLKYVKGRGGFFIEAGGNDGVTQSNTAYLERFRGWRGILVEPIPLLAERCRQNRSASIVEQCALAAFGHAEPTIEMNYCNLMSLVRGARGSDEADQQHLDAGRRFLADDEEVYSVTVPVRTLSDILDAHQVERIDLLSLDVEGFEAEALRGLDLSRHRPRHILVEANDLPEIESILLPFYDRIAQLSHHDYLYAAREPLAA